MRFSLVIATTLALLCASSGSTAASSDVKLYMRPAPSTAPVAVTAPELADVLSKHLRVPGQSDAPSSEGQRTVVLMSGMEGINMDEIVPERLRATHTLRNSAQSVADDDAQPDCTSFEALLHTYGERVYAADASGLAQQFSGFFVSAIEGMEHALENAADWMMGTSMQAVAAGKKTLDQVDLADGVTRPFYESLRNLVVYLDTIGGRGGNKDANEYQAVRFDGLGEIKSAYGEDSRQYQHAKQALRNVLQAAVDKMEALELQPQQQVHALALVVVPSRRVTAESGLVKRADPLKPFRSSLAVTPFLRTRDEEARQAPPSSPLDSPASSTLAKSPPKASDYAGKCFKSSDDLNKATKDCSSRGKAVRSSKGGRQCYRCRCEKTRDKGRVTEWTGDACERVAFGKPYVLLAVTTIALLLVTLLSVMHLFYEGQQELPSVLAGISIPNKSQ